MGLHEVSAGLQQQSVAGFQFHVPDLSEDSLAIAMNRHNRGIVMRAKLRIADGLPDQRRRATDDGFAESPTPFTLSDRVRCFGGRFQSRNLLEIDDGVHNPREDQPVIGFQYGIRTDRRND